MLQHRDPGCADFGKERLIRGGGRGTEAALVPKAGMAVDEVGNWDEAVAASGFGGGERRTRLPPMAGSDLRRSSMASAASLAAGIADSSCEGTSGTTFLTSCSAESLTQPSPRGAGRCAGAGAAGGAPMSGQLEQGEAALVAARTLGSPRPAATTWLAHAASSVRRFAPPSARMLPARSRMRVDG